MYLDCAEIIALVSPFHDLIICSGTQFQCSIDSKKKNLNSCQRKSKVRYAVWWSSIGKMTVHVVLSYLPQIYWEPWWLKVSNSFHHIRFCGIYDLLHLLYWKDGICLNIYNGNHNVNLQSTLIPVCSLK